MESELRSMTAFLFPSLTILYLALLISVLRRSTGQWTIGRGAFAAFLAVLAADALVISLGQTIGEGDLLLGLNRLRVTLRVFALPCAVIAAFDQVRRAGLEWAAGRGSLRILTAASLGLSALGVYSVLSRRDLVVERFGGTLQYKVPGIAGPTIAAILAMTLLITFGMILFRRAGTPWMAVAATLLFVGSVVPPSLVGPVTGSITEALFAAALFTMEGDSLGAPPSPQSQPPEGGTPNGY
ncbi:MAG: hypothetical protein ACKVX9_20820 [Blastocatellia bacterium]